MTYEVNKYLKIQIYDYYSSADYDKISFINLSLKFSHDFKINQYFILPIYLNYTYNSANQNIASFDKNFVVCGLKLNYQK